MEITEDKKRVCADAARLIWKLGVHEPQDAAVAFNFTKFVEELMQPTKPVKDKAK